MNKLEHLSHGFGPLYDENCEILILGSFPSPKSRQVSFYYGHPKNRFWLVLANVLNEEVPQTIEQKRNMCLKHHIALWDSIEECDIVGASDASIKNVVPTDIAWLLSQSKITKIFTVGKKSDECYRKYNYSKTNIEPVCLKSTSPANCAYKIEDLIENFRQILD